MRKGFTLLAHKTLYLTRDENVEGGTGLPPKGTFSHQPGIQPFNRQSLLHEPVCRQGTTEFCPSIRGLRFNGNEPVWEIILWISFPEGAVLFAGWA